MIVIDGRVCRLHIRWNWVAFFVAVATVEICIKNEACILPSVIDISQCPCSNGLAECEETSSDKRFWRSGVAACSGSTGGEGVLSCSDSGGFADRSLLCGLPLLRYVAEQCSKTSTGI